MKKRIGIVFVLMLMFSIKSVSATSFYNYLPGGKNYLDEDNFVVTSDYLSTINGFLVKGSTFYTLSFPGIAMIGSDISLEISGNDLYFDDSISNDPNCYISEQESYCTFETSASEDYINILFWNSSVASYITYFGFSGFQLEEGVVRTYYEEYIIPLVDSNNPEFSGSGAYIKSYSTFETIENIIDGHISVVDEVDGDITENILIISDSYTGNEEVVGEYLVELSASDFAGNTSYFNLNVLVKDEIEPVITGPDSVTYNVLGDININTIIGDNFIIEDGYSSVTINIIGDNYTLNKDIIGTYTVSFEVEDEYLNVSFKTFQIALVDTEIPTIISNLSINSFLSNPLNLTDILNTLEFHDNYTDMSNVDIDIITNEFEGNESIPGTYTMNFNVSDSSINTMNSNLIINVIDDISPQIGGPLTYQGSYTEELTIDDFKNMLNISDNIDFLSINDIYIIDDTYTNRNSVTGSFTISFGIKDSNQNENIHTIEITLFDDVAPIIYTDNFIVTVDSASTFSTDDAITLLINSEELVEGSYSVRTLFDGYTGNEKTEGTYVYLLEFTNNDGVSYEKEFVVNVIDDNENDFDKNLVIRNIVLYSMSIVVFAFVIIKNKK